MRQHISPNGWTPRPGPPAPPNGAAASASPGTAAASPKPPAAPPVPPPLPLTRRPDAAGVVCAAATTEQSENGERYPRQAGSGLPPLRAAGGAGPSSGSSGAPPGIAIRTVAVSV